MRNPKCHTSVVSLFCFGKCQIFSTFLVSPALPAPDYGLALYDRQVAEVLERVDQHTQGEAGLLQDRLSLRDLVIRVGKNQLTQVTQHLFSRMQRILPNQKGQGF